MNQEEMEAQKSSKIKYITTQGLPIFQSIGQDASQMSFYVPAHKTEGDL